MGSSIEGSEVGSKIDMKICRYIDKKSYRQADK